MKKTDYGSRFLYAEDLLIGGEFKSPEIEITEVHEPGSLTAANKQKIDKWSVSFKGKDKILVLCKTNVSIVHIVTGELPGESWIGKKIKIQVRVVDAFGAKTLAIRVIPPVGTVLRKAILDRLGSQAVFES